MSKIVAKYNVVEKRYILEISNLDQHYADVFAGIDNGGTKILFSNFSCGYELTHNGTVVSSYSWPEPGVKYIETTDGIIESARVYWEPGWNVVLKVWFNNWGVHIEQSWPITVPPLDETVPA